MGSLLRTAECLGVTMVFFSGYTPYPDTPEDSRLPHIRRKLAAQIEKTALGAEKLVSWRYEADVQAVLKSLRADGYELIGLEQDSRSQPLPSWSPPPKAAILLGREVEGIDPALLAQCDTVVEIPQFGSKESLNVVQAAAIALYQARFVPYT